MVLVVALARLLGGPGEVERFEQLWKMGLVLFGAHLGVLAWLTRRSPVVAWTLAVACAGYVVDGFGTALGHPVAVAGYAGLGELVLMVWLRGRSAQGGH